MVIRIVMDVHRLSFKEDEETPTALLGRWEPKSWPLSPLYEGYDESDAYE